MLDLLLWRFDQTRASWRPTAWLGVSDSLLLGPPLHSVPESRCPGRSRHRCRSWRSGTDLGGHGPCGKTIQFEWQPKAVAGNEPIVYDVTEN
jgi:hypothetical protein